MFSPFSRKQTNFQTIFQKFKRFDKFQVNYNDSIAIGRCFNFILLQYILPYVLYIFSYEMHVILNLNSVF